MKYGRIALGLFLLTLVAGISLFQSKVSPLESAELRSSGSIGDYSSDGLEVQVSDPVIPEITGAARDLPPYHPDPTIDREINPRQRLNTGIDPDFRVKGGPDPLLKLQENAPDATDAGFATPIHNFEGQGFSGYNPPDTVGDVGANHYVQMINSTGVAVYNKVTGALIDSFNFSSLGGCTTDTGDPVVLYDHAADRWLLSEFGPGNSLCVMISTTPDPLDTYYSYQFNTPSFPDYPKYGVWNDAYYVTTNENSPAAYALDRTSMLSGAAATSQRFTAPALSGFSFQSMTPADWDGSLAPPAGAPGYFMRHRDTEAHGPAGYDSEDFLEVWAFDVDFATPANSSFSKIADISVTEFDSDLCGFFSFSAIAMPNVAKCSGSSLDPLREVVMFRLQYRNFGSHETLVGNFTTDVTGEDDAGVRWFELRKVGAGNWALYQEGTYAPDSDSRWMGAIAMDGAGNIALGYNVSSAVTYPSLRYAGRLSSDPPGTLPQGENVLVDGTYINGSNRYGDYAAMSVDPVDDCTFWFTGEYNPNPTLRWSTRIGAFRFDACGFPDFTLSADPSSQAICSANNAVYDVSVGSISDYDDPVTLSSSGAPAGTYTDFSTNPVTPAGDSVMTISGTGAVPFGSYDIQITGIGPTSTHTTTVGLDVFDSPPATASLSSPADASSSQPIRPTFTWTNPSQAAEFLIEIAEDPGFSSVIISASTSATSFIPETELNTSTSYYWRVTASNICGVGTTSTAYSFTTQAAPGDCEPGLAASEILSEDFETGAPGWSTGGNGSTWALGIGVSPGGPPSGSYVAHADDVNIVSDQYLVSPEVSLPESEQPLSLRFWNYQDIESSLSGCYDAGVLEITVNGGSSWTRLESELLTDPYDGSVSNGYENPLAGENGWCGDPQDWLNSIVDLNAFAGQTVQFRWRLATDLSVSQPGWDVDDVVVQSCQNRVLDLHVYLPLAPAGTT